ncbi:MAG: hypothetical protein ACE5LU_28340, partial [Anaerolineae bacterium]
RETPGPFLIDFAVEPADIVYPMVPAGADLDKMIRRPLPERIAALRAEWTPQPDPESQET